MLADIFAPEDVEQAIRTGKILLLALLVYLILRMVVVRLIAAVAERTRTDWDRAFVRRGTFNRLAALAPGVLVYVQAGMLFDAASRTGEVLRLAATLWILLFALLALYAAVDSCCDIYNTLTFARQLPIRSFAQVFKLIAFLVFAVVSVSMLMGKSPTLLVSGLGAMTAVLMLIFKDPILGFVAGITLSANRMLAVGDWLEMPKYGADGDVTEITLTTVKVRNWDQTITTVPTYALISDSFKNWRGMQESGGRRICRSVFIDMNSIRFLTAEDIGELSKAELLADYIRRKLESIETENRERGVDPSSPMNGRRLTNIGTFRAYLASYIHAHPGINHSMIAMVRQLHPTESGLPIQLYTFTADTAWVAHEGVQADIFDHVLAVIPAFGLRVFQAPSGADIRALASRTAGAAAPRPAAPEG